MFNPRNTVVRRASANQPEPALIAEAADLIRRGRLVAFPTETVYGLGANALDETAVNSIFAAKGRPPENPVIVHVADALAAQLLARDWPEKAAKLAERFWPGSLTLVLPKQPMVPDAVTAGGVTVGLRVPAHPVALALLQMADVPIAAPSANRSTQISPTTADHVLRGLEGRIDLLLDAGPTSGGLESTVLDLTVDPPQLLRPGLVTVAQIEEVVGPIAVDKRLADETPTTALKSPGLLERHYAPRAKVVCVRAGDDAIVLRLLAEVNQVGWLRFCLNTGRPHPSPLPEGEGDFRRLRMIEMPTEAAEYSARLYAALHELDDAAVDVIVVDLPPRDNAWLAVHDRLRRASH
jgi:L-threonylcarbamoyladenylate synthase